MPTEESSDKPYGTVQDVVRNSSQGRRQLSYTVAFDDGRTGGFSQIAIVRGLIEPLSTLAPSADGHFERAPDAHGLIGAHVRQWIGNRLTIGVVAWVEYLVYAGRKVPNAFTIYPRNESRYIPVTDLLEGDAFSVCQKAGRAQQDTLGFDKGHDGLHRTDHVTVAYDDATEQYHCDVVFAGVRWLRREIAVLDDFRGAKFHANKLADLYAHEVQRLFVEQNRGSRPRQKGIRHDKLNNRWVVSIELPGGGATQRAKLKVLVQEFPYNPEAPHDEAKQRLLASAHLSAMSEVLARIASAPLVQDLSLFDDVAVVFCARASVQANDARSQRQ
jgi:hypothetical protein